MKLANHRVCVYLNLDYLRYKFGMKFQPGRGLNLGWNFAWAGKKFKANCLNLIRTGADTIKLYKEQISILIVNLRHTKAWTTNIILKLVDGIYAMFISIAAVKF